MPVAVDHGCSVGLGEGVAQRSEVAGLAHVERRRLRQAQLEATLRLPVGDVQQDGADAPRAPRSCTANSSKVLEDLAVLVLGARRRWRRSTG